MSVTLTYSTTSVVLKSPEHNDTKKFDLGTIVRENRHHEVKTYRSTSWPSINTISYEFVGLHESDFTALKALFTMIAGRVFTLLDYNGDSHQVYLLSDLDAITTLDVCGYDISLEFMEVEV